MKTHFKVSEMLDILNADGWILKNQQGSHRHFTHPQKKGKVTVAGKPSADISKDDTASIFKQAGLQKPR